MDADEFVALVSKEMGKACPPPADVRALFAALDTDGRASLVILPTVRALVEAAHACTQQEEALRALEDASELGLLGPSTWFERGASSSSGC